MTTPTRLSGFSPAATEFFEDLEDQNTREFWLAHKDVFDREIRDPMAALLDSLPEEYQPFKVFRMNRDIRFSADKSPYKIMRREYPDVGVLVLSQYVEVGLAMRLLADSAEGVGYLLKDRVSEVKDFIAALRRVADGGSALDPTIVSTMLKRHRSSDPLDSLTPREREVLELMATGASNAGIAESMVITQRAAEKYVSTIFTKLGIPATGSESRRVLAVLLFLRS